MAYISFFPYLHLILRVHEVLVFPFTGGETEASGANTLLKGTDVKRWTGDLNLRPSLPTMPPPLLAKGEA